MWKITSGIFLGWGLGANDSANIFGTGVTTGVIKYKTAVLLTGIFVLMGSLIDGPKCMETVSDLSRLFPADAFCCALAAAVTMAILTFFAIPASASQAIIGAVIGAGILSGTADFSKLFKIFSCWIFTPVLALILGYLFHRFIGYLLDRTITNMSHRNLLYYIGIITTGCYAAYALGGNNVANVTGVYVGSGILSVQNASLIGGLSIAAGVLTYSKKVMMTIGKGIAPLDPFSALITILAEALTLNLFTHIGVPVSSSQAIVGAIVGVGIVKGMKTVRSRMLIKIGLGWIMTPVSAGLSAYCLIRFVVH